MKDILTLQKYVQTVKNQIAYNIQKFHQDLGNRSKTMNSQRAKQLKIFHFKLKEENWLFYRQIREENQLLQKQMTESITQITTRYIYLKLLWNLMESYEKELM